MNLKTDYLFDEEEIEQEFFFYTKNSVDIKDVFYVGEGVTQCTPQNTSDECLPTDIFGQSPLRYKVYYPHRDFHDYVTTPLPVIILFHAGGFQECTHLELSIMKTLCEELSRKGFIAITAEYRRGRLKDDTAVPGTNLFYTSVQQQLASYRAQQDGRGAICSIMKRDNLNAHQNRFKINPEQVFIGGTSAGGIVAMGAAYYRTQAMVNQAFPKKGNTANTIQHALGPIQADYYYGGATYWPVIRGVLNCWGGIAIPKSSDNNEAAFFANGAGADDNPPMIAFHGAKDEVIRYFDDVNQDFYFSKQGMNPPNQLLFVEEEFCLELMNNEPYVIKSSTNNAPVTVKMCSSINMYNVLSHSSINKFTEVYIDCNMGHGLDANSDFGISLTGSNPVEKYIAQRTAVFFQTIMREPNIEFGDKGRSIFRDCENNRVCTTSGTGENNDCDGSNDIECPSE